MLWNQRLKIVESYSSALSPYSLAILEEHKRRNWLNAILHRDGFVLVNINLDYTYLVAKIILQLFKYRMHRLARTAPCGIEINKYQLPTLDYVIEFLHNCLSFRLLIEILCKDTDFVVAWRLFVIMRFLGKVMNFNWKKEKNAKKIHFWVLFLLTNHKNTIN